MSDLRVLGYYRWEGDACRMVEDQAQPGSPRAEIYCAGQGFLPVNSAEMLEKAVEVGEEAFKELVMETIRLHREP